MSPCHHHYYYILHQYKNDKRDLSFDSFAESENLNQIYYWQVVVYQILGMEKFRLDQI